MIKKLSQFYHGSAAGRFLLELPRKVYRTYRFRLIPEERFIKQRFKQVFGRELDLENPQTFNEKIQWLKLHDRTPLHTQCTDKYAMRQYVAERIGKEYLVHLLYHTENPADITPENLPEPPFVVKTNHAGSVGMTFVKDKSEIDWKGLRKTLAKEMKENYYYARKEWQYKTIRPRIVVERMLRTEDGNIPFDYKFHCFNGRLVFIQVDIDRQIEHKRNLYDAHWNPIACQWLYQNGDQVQKPHMMNRMRSLAEVIAKDFVYVRVDFYILGTEVFIGELTFHSESGFGPFTPSEWDRKLGDMLILPDEKKTAEDNR